MRKTVIFLLISISLANFAAGQEPYDVCQNALLLCPNQVYSVNNLGAHVTSCVNCEDDFNYCFVPDNTVWFRFETNTVGGAVQIDFSNLAFQLNAGQDTELQAVLIQANFPCDAGSYTQVGTCHSNETSNFSLAAAGLLPSTVYYLAVDGDNTGAGITAAAECTFDLQISGAGVDRAQPTSGMGQSASSICLNDIVTFSCALTDCPDTSAFNWFVNGDLVATTTDALYQTSGLQDGDVVSVSNTCYANCPITVQSTASAMSVYVVPVDAGIDVTILSGTTIQLNGSTTAPIHFWSPPFLVSNPNVLSPFITPTETTVFALTAEENGCTLTDYVIVTIEEGLEIPNTFSPNGDGVNDTWEIDGLEMYPDNQMAIYTRWGQKVFETSAYSNLKAWDGENHRETVYYYVLDLNDDSNTQYKGTITVIR